MRSRWLAALDGAGFGFLVLVATGALLVTAGKLQFPDLGTDADVPAVLAAIVMTGLACLGATVNIGGVGLATVPLGALLAVGAAVAWGARRAVGRRTEEGESGRALMGLRVGISFGVLCMLAAFLFRIRTEPTPIGADALSALLHGSVWAGLFGVLGALGPAGAGDQVRRAVRAVPDRWSAAAGVEAAVLALGAMLGLGTVAALVWIVAGLARGPEAPFGFAEATASLLYILAFGPNIVAALVGLGLGAPIEAGARLTESGRVVGRFHDYSVLDWAGGPTPAWVYLLWLIPLLAGTLAGIHLARSSSAGTFARSALVSAALVGLVAYEFAALSGARLGAGLVTQNGVAAIAPHAGLVLVLAAAWSLAGAYLGRLLVSRTGIALAGHDRIVAR